MCVHIQEHDLVLYMGACPNQITARRCALASTGEDAAELVESTSSWRKNTAAWYLISPVEYAPALAIVVLYQDFNPIWRLVTQHSLMLFRIIHQ
jgi:hypothetical protein